MLLPYFKITILVLSILLASCRGESGPPSVDLSLSIETIYLNMPMGSKISKEIKVDFNGDGLIFGASPRAQTIPSWLRLVDKEGSSNSATFELLITAPGLEDVYTTTLRFVTGLNNTDVFAYKDVEITINTMSAIEIDITAMQGQNNLPDPRAIYFNGSLLKPGYSTAISYANNGIEDWLTISEDQERYVFSVLTTNLKPDEYQAIVSFTTPDSQEILVDVTYTTTEPTISFSEIPEITITNQTKSDELTFTASVEGESGFLDWLVSDSSNMITANRIEDSGNIEINILDSNLKDYQNGSYEQWIDISYKLPSSSIYKVIKLNFNLNLSIASIKSLTPSVSYSGHETLIRIWGEELDQLTDEQLLLTNTYFSNITRINENEIELTVSSSAEDGEYAIFINNDLDFDQLQAKFVIKPAPVFPVVDLTLPSRVTNVTYDAIREKFYFTEGYNGSASYSISHNGENWYWTAYAIDSPSGLALTIDGEKLIIGNYNCEIYEIELATNVISMSNLRENCIYDEYGFIGQFYNGTTIAANTDQWPSIYSYPDWSSPPFSLPNIHNPIGFLSQYNTHMVWTGGNYANREAHIYDARSNTVNTLGTVTKINYNEFSISAMGERISHYNDIYNSQLAHIGSLGDLTHNSLNKVGVSPDGTRAAMYINSNDLISVYDISGNSAPLTKLDNDIEISEEGSFVIDRIVFSEDNHFLFVFTYNGTTKISKMRVFEL